MRTPVPQSERVLLRNQTALWHGSSQLRNVACCACRKSGIVRESALPRRRYRRPSARIPTKPFGAHRSTADALSARLRQVATYDRNRCLLNRVAMRPHWTVMSRCGAVTSRFRAPSGEYRPARD